MKTYAVSTAQPLLGRKATWLRDSGAFDSTASKTGRRLDRHNQPANKRLHGMVQAASIETHNQDTKQAKHSPACQNTWNIQDWLKIIRATVAKAVLAETPCALKQPKVEQTESQQSAVHRLWRERA